MLYSDAERRKKLVKEFIIKNPNTTFREIKKKLHTKINKLYLGGMAEAFKDAGISSPRNFKVRTFEEKRQAIINYIKNHPVAGGHTINKATKINLFSVFKNTEDAFLAAGIIYPRKKIRKLKLRSADERKRKAIMIVRENPLISVEELGKKLQTHIYSLFNNIGEIYDLAGVDYVGRGEKRTLKKRLEIIKYIRNNPLATQREINSNCKTHVQYVFDEGIFQAYKEAGITFPYKRLNLHGAALKNIKEDAVKFEKKVATKLSGYGSVTRLVRTKRGFADIIFERKSKKVVIEVKDYKIHEISISQVKQLNKYLEDCRCKLGFLVCHKKPKIDTFLIGKNRLFLIEESELGRIPKIIDNMDP